MVSRICARMLSLPAATWRLPLRCTITQPASVLNGAEVWPSDSEATCMPNAVP